MASVPCRCGQNWAYRRSGAGAAQIRHLGQDGGRVEHLDVVTAAEHVRQDVPGLAAMRRAGDVADHAARADCVQRAAEQAALQPGRGPGRPGPSGASGPRGGGAGPRSRSTGRPPAPGRRPRAARQVRSRSTAAAAAAPVTDTASRASRARCGRASVASRCAPRCAARPASSRALPPGPAHMSSHRWSGPVSPARATAIAASWLASSWTAARRALTASIAAGSPPAR